MKNIGLFLVSVTGFFIMLGCLFYNLLLIDMNKIKDYVTESNCLLEQVVNGDESVNEQKGKYISRLLTIKKELENSSTSFLFNKYKVVKISQIELLIEAISEENEEDKKDYLRLVLKSDDESKHELDSLMNKNFIEVTYLYLKTYTNVK